jgi:Zn-dependent protease
VGIDIRPAAAPQSTVGTTAGTVPVSLPANTPVSATAAANTAVVITLAAVAGVAIRLTALSFGYSVAAGTAILTVVSNGVTLLQLPIAALLGFGSVPLPDGGLEGAAGFSVVITLPAGAATAVGALNVASYTGA